MWWLSGVWNLAVRLREVLKSWLFSERECVAVWWQEGSVVRELAGWLRQRLKRANRKLSQILIAQQHELQHVFFLRSALSLAASLVRCCRLVHDTARLLHTLRHTRRDVREAQPTPGG